MRIRSIKPEFWRSSDITSLPIEDRLLFIGLWSYVDDNGVGRGEEASIVGDLFAADMFANPRETVARVSRGLLKLSESNLIKRYEVAGKQYLQICAWDSHQRIDKPGKPRFPRYDADSRDTRETLATVSEKVAPGTGEQGNRGTEEQRNRGAENILSDDESSDHGSLIADDWKPNQKHIDLANSLHLDIERETFRFRTHAVQNQRRLKNWSAGFTNWLKNGAVYAQKRGGTAAPRQMTRTEANLAYVQQLEEQERATSAYKEIAQ